MLINAKLKTGKRVKKQSWRKSFKEAKARVGMYCHLRTGQGGGREEEMCSPFPELIHSKGQRGKT